MGKLLTRRFIVRRFVYCAAQLVGLIALDYLLVRLMIQSWGVIPQYYEITQETYEHLMRIKGYWEARLPLPYGFFLYFVDTLAFRFGPPSDGDYPSVVELLALHLPNTLLLMALAAALTVGLSLTLGILSTARRSAKVSRAVKGMGLVFYAVPAFVLGLALLCVVCFLFPQPTGILSSPRVSLNPLDNAVLVARKLALAVITVAFASCGGYAVLIQRNFVDHLGQSRPIPGPAKDAEERAILRTRTQQSSTLWIATMVALTLGFFITAVVLTEPLFNWSGVGHLIVDATIQEYYAVVQAVFYILGLTVILANFIVDILRGFLDSRIRCD